MDSHAHGPDHSPHRSHPALRYLFLRRRQHALAQSRMVVAGSSRLLLRASRHLRPQAPEACGHDYPDRRVGYRYLRHPRFGPGAKADADCKCGRDIHPDAIPAAALHLHDDGGRDGVARNRSLSRPRSPMAADPDVRAMGQLSRRLHRRTRRDGRRYRNLFLARISIRRCRPQNVGNSAGTGHLWMRRGHRHQPIRRRPLDGSVSFGQRPADSPDSRRLGATAEADAIDVTERPVAITSGRSAATDVRCIRPVRRASPRP